MSTRLVLGSRALLCASALALLALQGCSGSNDTSKAQASQAAPSGDPLPVGVATEHTRLANAAVLKELDFSDKAAYAAAQKGFIARLDDPKILGKDGNYMSEKGVVYDASKLDFLNNAAEAPPTANPSLWRQAQINNVQGLYKIAERIYQFRGYDITNLTLIEGKTGWILVDPNISPNVAAAGLKLANEKLGARPVKAILITHSHGDHFGGMLGVTTLEDIKAGKVQVIVPEAFMEEAVSEQLYTGNIIDRRSGFSYGFNLPTGPAGTITNGLGVPAAQDIVTLAPPTQVVSRTGQKLTVDGLDVVFQMAPHTEAPAEMLFYFPQLKALCLAEDGNQLMHNLYSIRGTKVRDARVWAQTLNTALEMFGADAQMAFSPHTWPVYGNESIRTFLGKQRDMYKYINDQSLRLANNGYDAVEISNMIKLPPSLDKEFYNRGYYGALKHNARAVYDFYLGYFNGNPAELDPLPRIDAARLYVEAMGGIDNVLKLGRKAFDAGDYRWTAQLVNHAVYADPENKAARELQAAALEQMGFQAESATWRGFYLTAAMELRQYGGERRHTRPIIDPATIPVPMAVDYLAALVDPAKAQGKAIRVGLALGKQKYTLRLENSVLNLGQPFPGEKLDASYTLDQATFGRIVKAQAKAADEAKSGALKADGNAAALDDIVAVFSMPSTDFPLVWPNKP
ncbi:alkyl/aryl-sulfatase [Variovorax sp. OV329]|uniref:alkyl/aryl-sulfatase n=1 Tax=Variovorax sp. OV329 TaxID=1882825 RepID=UPI0008EE7E2C|nr:alkyl sulfatase dimerization domain-containing protein [Variovorax sp. OV329]SFN02305.1 Alkyl sulfatase BDS1, metallo-beta-lactamase superfamily [Variovorax sp. OV329]